MTNYRYSVLVTGGEGFIGRNFIKLYSDKYTITAPTTDIRELEFSLFDGYDFVLHLAGLAGVRRSHEEPQLYWEHNVRGSANIFSQAIDSRIPVIYASSSSVYEWWLSPYATTKKVVEQIAPIRSLGLRFHTVYGDDSRPDMLYDRLLKKDPTLTYLSNHTRDYTHVNDVCSAISLSIDNFFGTDLPRAIDIGAGTPVKVVDVANKVWPDNNLPIKEVTGERAHTCANPTILNMLGWKPKHNILLD